MSWRIIWNEYLYVHVRPLESSLCYYDNNLWRHVDDHDCEVFVEVENSYSEYYMPIESEIFTS